MSLEDQLLVQNANTSDEQVSSTPPPTLSKPLAMLFSINGVTMALPGTSLLYIVNKRVEMPLTLLPTYAAISFLPFSLKPMYAILSSRSMMGSIMERHTMISILLFFGAVSMIGTAWVGGVAGCFLIAFANCLSNAWAEFLLGLTLVDEASSSSVVGVTSAAFQSQAATHRNIGSLVAYLFVWFWMIVQHEGEHRMSGELNDRIVKELLLLTAVVNLVGTVIARVSRVGTSSGVVHLAHRSYEQVVDNAEQDDEEEESESFDTTDLNVGQSTAWKGTSVRLIVLLQITILLLSLQQPVEELTSFSFWIIMMMALAIAWCFVIRSAASEWPRSHRTGLYLILRHAVPSVSYLMESFMYDAFATTAPTFLTILSVWDTLTISLASWSYGVLFRDCHRAYSRMMGVIVGTTAVAAVTFWMANSILIVLLRRDDDEDSGERMPTTWTVLVSVLALKSILTVTGEWKFLPDVILATTTAYISENKDNPVAHAPSASRESDSDSVGLRYGSLIGCIDFGGMMGSFLIVPLVNMFGTSRENDWVNMESLILTGALATLLSAGLTVLLKK